MTTPELRTALLSGDWQQFAALVQQRHERRWKEQDIDREMTFSPVSTFTQDPPIFGRQGQIYYSGLKETR